MDEQAVDQETLGNLSDQVAADLRGRYWTEIPPSVFDATNLEILDLSRNRIRELPPEIAKLTRLRRLILRKNDLTTIPPEIGRLKDLEHLDLSQNPLVGIPPEVQTIVPSFHASSLPPEIRHLTNLLTLDLSECRLSSLPPEIGQLARLRSLKLDGNELRSLPAEIGKLGHLEHLDLSHNSMWTLTPDLADLPSTVDLRLTGLPLLDPLPELVAQGTPALFTYLRSIAQAGVRSYEAKVLFVGEGNVGKTSLMASLRDDPFVKDRPTTHGVEIAQLRLSHPKKASEITLNMWDFGGQEVYRITQQFFFSRRALYLLVWRPREGSEENAIEAWCRRIRLRIGDDARILLVATYGDERRIELDYPYLKRQFGALLVQQFTVDNQSGSGIRELRNFVGEQAAALKHMGELVSRNWLAVHASLRDRQEPQIDFEQFARICAHHGVDRAQAAILAVLLHDHGHIIHYSEDDGLRDVVVLKPEWLTKAIGYVLEDRETEQAMGVLDHRRLRQLWQDPRRNATYDQRYHPYFLRLMEKFDVSYRIDETKSLVAQLVPYTEPPLPWDESTPIPPGRRQLVLLCQMAEAPPGLVAWMTVRNHRFSTGRHWRRGMFLAHPEQDAEALIRADQANSLKLIVRAPSPDFFFSVLRDSMEDLIQKRWKGLHYELLAPCPHTSSDGSRCQGNFELNTLKAFRERSRGTIECRTCFETVGVNELLTGFAVTEPPLRQVLDSVQSNAETLRQELRRAQRVQAGEVEEMHREVAAIQADLAQQLRGLLKAVGKELPGCPRLFTLVPQRPKRFAKLRAWQAQYRLTLWCEHPGQEHPCPSAQYDFSCTRERFREIAPYVLAVSQVLRAAIPLSSAALGVLLREPQLKHLNRQLDLMKAVAEQVLPRGGKELSLPSGAGWGVAADGAALRALRALLVQLDPSMVFGDLRRVMTPAADYVWVCKDIHYREYDPGLPRLSQ